MPFKRWIFFLGYFCLSPVFASSGQELNRLILSPQFVAQRALELGVEAQQIRLERESRELPLAQALSVYDVLLAANLDYEISQAETLTGFSNKEDRTLGYGLSLKKDVGLGQTWSVGYDRTSMASELNPFISQNALQPDSKTLDVFYLSVEQQLLKNAFGMENRYKVKSAQQQVLNASLNELETLEDLVVESLTHFWDVYVAKENLEEALASRDRYESLVNSVRKKARIGYAGPGELSRVQAELEAQIQRVKRQSALYLNSLDELLRRIQTETSKEVEFQVTDLLPTLPQPAPAEVESLRQVRLKENEVEISKLALKIKSSENQADLKLMGKATYTGADENSSEAFSELSAATRPVYFVGLQLSYALFSEKRRGEIQQARVIKSQAENELTIAKDQLKNEIKKTLRLAQAQFQIAESAIKTVELRKKALKELERSYNQGRTNILDVITAYNSLFAAQAARTRAIGDYHIALNKMAAARDQLIANQSEIQGREP